MYFTLDMIRAIADDLERNYGADAGCIIPFVIGPEEIDIHLPENHPDRDGKKDAHVLSKAAHALYMDFEDNEALYDEIISMCSERIEEETKEVYNLS